MQEIWLLQPRFALRMRKRVFRLLAHPRFRAAFDFLELRLAASNTHAEDVAFWREAQLHPAESVAANAQETQPEEGDEIQNAPRKRRRRRRPADKGPAE